MERIPSLSYSCCRDIFCFMTRPVLILRLLPSPKSFKFFREKKIEYHHYTVENPENKILAQDTFLIHNCSNLYWLMNKWTCEKSVLFFKYMFFIFILLLQEWIFMNCLTFLMEIDVNIMMMFLLWWFPWREGFGDHLDNSFFFSFFKCFIFKFWLGATFIFACFLHNVTILSRE